MAKPKRRTTRTTLPRLLALASFEADSVLTPKEYGELRSLIRLLRTEQILSVSDLETRLKYYHKILARATMGPISDPYSSGLEETKPQGPKP